MRKQISALALSFAALNEPIGAGGKILKPSKFESYDVFQKQLAQH
jgi:hypothetical protein